jgi:hypothetical protein
MKAIKVVSLMFAVASAALVHAHEDQNEAETRPQQANEQRTLPKDAKIGETGADVDRVNLGQFQQLFDVQDKVEDVDVSRRLPDTLQG